MTPERFEEIRRFHEEEVEIAADSEGFPGELTEEVHMIADLLEEVGRLRTQNDDLLAQINTDSDVMYLQHEEIKHWKSQIEEAK